MQKNAKIMQLKTFVYFKELYLLPLQVLICNIFAFFCIFKGLHAKKMQKNACSSRAAQPLLSFLTVLTFLTHSSSILLSESRQQCMTTANEASLPPYQSGFPAPATANHRQSISRLHFICIFLIHLPLKMQNKFKKMQSEAFVDFKGSPLSR